MKILNLYACLGGNRYKWNEVKNDIQVTAVELDPELARLYKERFPNDTVIVADAHKYLLEHYKEFDFIWSSPPCPSHSKSRFWAYGKTMPIYPDMKLYEEIIFLQYHALENQKWVIENVNGYYEPLVPAKKKGRHLFWANFEIQASAIKSPKGFIGQCSVAGKQAMQDWLGIHYPENIYYGNNHCPAQILRNCVHPDLGLQIFNCATTMPFAA
jgi:DNA (cytosine-5)-methyltransferase 1